MQLSAMQNRITSRYSDPKAVLAVISRRRHVINNLPTFRLIGKVTFEFWLPDIHNRWFHTVKQ